MKILPVFVFFIFCCLTVTWAQMMPVISGETAEKKTINVPADTKGKFTLFCFAGSMKAQKNLEGWLDPVYQKFIAKTGLMDDMFDVNVFFVPVVRGEGLNETIKRKFREKAQQDLWPHVLFPNSGSGDLAEKLKMEKDDQPYFFLVNTEGKIVYNTSGVFTEEKFDRIDDIISNE
jgi:hypothetical protein